MKATVVGIPYLFDIHTLDSGEVTLNEVSLHYLWKNEKAV